MRIASERLRPPVVLSESCRPFCIPDATMHSTRRADSPPRRYYVTSMATVLSAILFSAGLSSS